MKTETASATPALDYGVRLVGGIKTMLAFGEWRSGTFSGAAHVAVHYLIPATPRPANRFGWLPVEMWEGGTSLSTCRSQLPDVWN
jgi:hypothetical protein